MNVTQARKLYQKTETSLKYLDSALFGADEAEELGLNKEDQMADATEKLTAACDNLLALCDLDISASSIREEVKNAIEAAKEKPFASVIYVEEYAPEYVETDVYLHPIVLRSLLGRVANIYDLGPNQCNGSLSLGREHLLAICRHADEAIIYLMSKKLIGKPTGEHHVKHLLFGFVKAHYPDAVPDGSVVFNGEFRKHVPDFAVPQLKCCIETKVARNAGDLSGAVDGIIADQSTYGSDAYDMFIGVIYTNDPSLEKDHLDREIQDRYSKGGEPSYEWHWILIHGPLEASQSGS